MIHAPAIDGGFCYTEDMELDFSHHAYLIAGEAVQARAEVYVAIEADTGMPVARNPDVFFFEYDSLGIGESRQLKALQAMCGFGLKKYIIVSVRSITLEAQNALLKVLEEPMLGTYFILLMPDSSHLLPTVRSRLSSVGKVTRQKEDSASQEAKTFLASDIRTRMAMVKKMIDDKDKIRAQTFIDELERVMHQEFAQKPSPKHAEALLELEQQRLYLAGRSSSLKMIVEHLALIV